MKCTNTFSLLAAVMMLFVAVFALGAALSGSTFAQSEPEIVSLIREFEQLERDGDISYFTVVAGASSGITFDTDDETFASQVAIDISFSAEVVCFNGSTDTGNVFQSCFPYDKIESVTSFSR